MHELYTDSKMGYQEIPRSIENAWGGHHLSYHHMNYLMLVYLLSDVLVSYNLKGNPAWSRLSARLRNFSDIFSDTFVSFDVTNEVTP